MNGIIKYEDVENKILTIRNQNVIIDRDVAEIYGVTTKEVNQAVLRNPDKFPDGYIFSLSDEEKFELVTNCDRFEKLKHSTVSPTAFAKKGLYMLATILKSSTATLTTIAIIEAFANLREFSRVIKHLPKTTDEKEQMSLAKRASDAFMILIENNELDVTADETRMKFNLPFIEVERTVKREKRKE